MQADIEFTDMELALVDLTKMEHLYAFNLGKSWYSLSAKNLWQTKHPCML